MHKLGVALGRDSRSRGVNFMLGPAVNIARAPMDIVILHNPSFPEVLIEYATGSYPDFKIANMKE